MTKIVVDTSVIIDHLRSGTGIWEQLLSLMQAGKSELFISPIVITELWAGDSMNDEKVRRDVAVLISPLGRVEMTDCLVMKAGELIRLYKLSGFDALVAASALEIDALLATTNFKHFKQVPELNFFDKEKILS